ncbi:MAG: hypothetical protein Q8934_10265 [Bacillota bacterium]|nr:hypothetical protein [Bacillota bacterium]
MRWGPIIASTITVLFIFLFEWPKLQKNQKKEKFIFIILTSMGWCISILLFFFPDLPGPTKFIDLLFKPLGRMLE